MNVNKLHYSTADLTKVASVASLRHCHGDTYGFIYIYIKISIYAQ